MVIGGPRAEKRQGQRLLSLTACSFHQHWCAADASAHWEAWAPAGHSRCWPKSTQEGWPGLQGWPPGSSHTDAEKWNPTPSQHQCTDQPEGLKLPHHMYSWIMNCLLQVGRSDWCSFRLIYYLCYPIFSKREHKKRVPEVEPGTGGYSGLGQVGRSL